MSNGNDDWKPDYPFGRTDSPELLKISYAVIGVLVLALGGVMWWMMIDTRLRLDAMNVIAQSNVQRIALNERRIESLEKNYDRLLEKLDAYFRYMEDANHKR